MKLNEIEGAKPLVRTNVALSGNIQCIVNEQYNVKYGKLHQSNLNVAIEFDSIGGTYADNAVAAWKKMQMSSELIFDVANSDIKTAKPIMSYNDQYDWQYIFGCRHTKHPNVFRYFAPLQISKAKLPDYFVIFQCNATDNNNLQTLIANGKLICKWDLTKLSDIVEHQKQMHFAPIYVSHSESQQNKHYGFSIDTGKYIECDTGTVNVSDNELSPFDFDKQLVDKFASNKIACAHLVNLSFEFTDDTPGLHRYVGLYVDYATIQLLQKQQSLVDIQYYSKIDKSINLLEYTDASNKNATVKNTVVKLPTLIDYNRIYTEHVIAAFNENEGLRPNIYTQTRALTFRFTGNMQPGESFTILVNGKQDLQVYCIHQTDESIQDTDNWFSKKETIQDTIDAFIKAFNNATYSSTYAYSIKQIDAYTLKIVSNCGSNNISLQVNVAPYSVAVVESNTNIAWKPIIDFDTAITAQNSLLISKNIADYVALSNYLLLHIDNQTTIKTKILQTTTVQHITSDSTNDDSIVILVDAVLPDLVDSIAFDMLQIKNATSNLCYIYDLYDLQGFYDAEFPYMSNTEFDIDAWYNWMLSEIAKQWPNINDATRKQYEELAYTYYKSAQTNSTVNAIKSLSIANQSNEESSLQFSSSEYDKCHDLTVDYQQNKPNIRQHHFDSIYGTDSMNKGFRSNNSVAYNCTGLAPYEFLASYALDAFNYSWFIEGYTMPAYIKSLSIDNKMLIAKSYANYKISLQDLQSTTIDAYNKLIHAFDNGDDSTIVKCWTICFDKPGSTYAYAIFKGVEYVLSSNYIGYRFAVIHIDGTDIFNTQPQFIANHKFKTVTIALPYKIVDRALINLDGLLTTMYVDKSLLYSTAGVLQLKQLDNIEVKCSMSIADATKLQWLLDGERQMSPIVESWPSNSGEPVFGSSCILKDAIFPLQSIVKQNTTLKMHATIITSTNQTYNVNIELIDIVDVSYDTIWFRNCIYTAELLNGSITTVNLLEDVYNDATNKQTIFNGGNAIANNIMYYISQASIMLNADTIVSTNRFSPLAYFVQFSKINALQDIHCCAKYAQKTLVNAAYESNSKLYVTLSRYGLLCMPSLQQLTHYNAIIDKDVVLANTLLANPLCMFMYALTMSNDVCSYTKIQLLSTYKDAIYVNKDNTKIADTSKFREVPLLASICISLNSKMTRIGIKNAGMQPNKIDLVSILSILLNINADTNNLQYATFLLSKYSNCTIVYKDANGVIVQPIAIERQSAQYLIVQFEQQIGDIFADISFA